MKILRCFVCLAAVASFMPSDVQAGSPYPGSMFGSGYYGGVGNFFNPYSFPPSTSVRTPPYFAVHPPVYYSTRHARPYGMSPFAAPPMVAPSSSYHGRLHSEFVRPALIENPYCEVPGGHPEEIAVPPQSVQASVRTRGPVRDNPFATETPQLAKNR